MTMKSSFVAEATSGYGKGNFLTDSLSVMVADGRKGLGGVSNEITGMKAYVASHPGDTNAQAFNTYLAKVSAAGDAGSSAPQATARSTKPGSGMM